jgi:hypothetical protein
VPSAEPSTKLAFWIHQLVEYAVGLLLAYQAIHSPKPIIPLLAGLLVIALAATADGPAAAWRVVPRRVHRVLDVVMAVGLAVAAILLGDQVGGAGQIILGVGALGMGVLILRSDYRPRRPRSTTKTADGAPPMSSGERAELFGRSAGRFVGRGVQAYRRRNTTR